MIPFLRFCWFHVCVVNLYTSIYIYIWNYSSYLLRLCEPYGNFRRLGLTRYQAPDVFWLQVPGRAINKSKGVPYPCSSLWQGRPASPLGSLTIAGSVCFRSPSKGRIFINRRTSMLNKCYFVYLSLANSITVWQVCLCCLSLLFAALKGRYIPCFVSSTEGSQGCPIKKQSTLLHRMPTFGDLCCVC